MPFKDLECGCTLETKPDGSTFLHYNNSTFEDNKPCENKKHIPKGLRDRNGEAE